MPTTVCCTRRQKQRATKRPILAQAPPPKLLLSQLRGLPRGVASSGMRSMTSPLLSETHASRCAESCVPACFLVSLSALAYLRPWQASTTAYRCFAPTLADVTKSPRLVHYADMILQLAGATGQQISDTPFGNIDTTHLGARVPVCSGEDVRGDMPQLPRLTTLWPSA